MVCFDTGVPIRVLVFRSTRVEIWRRWMHVSARASWSIGQVWLYMRMRISGGRRVRGEEGVGVVLRNWDWVSRVI